MAERQVYVDYNATTPLKDGVKAAMINDLDIFGNASSMHRAGRLAHARVEEARAAVALLLGAPAKDIVFSSGGSESNNTLFATMRSLASASDGSPLTTGRREFIITDIEHPCVFNSAEHTRNLGFKVTSIPVDGCGKVKLDALKAALSEKTLFVSVMMANNEIGTVQDIKEITRLVKEAGAFMHTDAIQAVGKIPVDVVDLGVDYLTLSAHKI